MNFLSTSAYLSFIKIKYAKWQMTVDLPWLQQALRLQPTRPAATHLQLQSFQTSPNLHGIQNCKLDANVTRLMSSCQKFFSIEHKDQPEENSANII